MGVTLKEEGIMGKLREIPFHKLLILFPTKYNLRNDSPSYVDRQPERVSTEKQ